MNSEYNKRNNKNEKLQSKSAEKIKNIITRGLYLRKKIEKNGKKIIKIKQIKKNDWTNFIVRNKLYNMITNKDR